MSKKTEVKKTPKKRKGLRIGLCIFLVVVMLAVVVITNYESVLGLFGISSDFSDQTQDNDKYTLLSVKENLYNSVDTDILLGDTNYINVLLFGLDEDEERQSQYSVFRPDTIMLVSVNFDTEQISIVSIPRDTYVPIYGRGGKDKINTCFYYGTYKPYNNKEEMYQNGVDILKGTVSNILGGIPIHYYVGVNMDTAADIVDAMGGVRYNLKHDAYFDSNNLFYTAGERVWNGKDFITLARLRGYSNGDIDRAEVQQDLLKALFAAVKEIKLSKIPGVIKLAYKSIKTDIDMKTAISFVLAALDIDTSNIKTATMPGFFGAYHNVSYWVVNQSGRVGLIKDFYGINASAMEQDPPLIITYLYEEIDGLVYKYYINENSRVVYVDDHGAKWSYDELSNYYHAPETPDTPEGGGETNPSEGGGETEDETPNPEGGGTTTPETGGAEGGTNQEGEGQTP